MDKLAIDYLVGKSTGWMTDIQITIQELELKLEYTKVDTRVCSHPPETFLEGYHPPTIVHTPQPPCWCMVVT